MCAFKKTNSRKSGAFALLLLLAVIIAGILDCSEIVIEKSDETWSFVVFGDLRQGFGIYGKLVAYMEQINPQPAFAVCLGDIMRVSSTVPEWKKFVNYSKPIADKFPLYIVRGNHEGNDVFSQQLCRDYMGIGANEPFYYTMAYRNCGFIFLDTEIPLEEGSITNMQLSWLKSQLARLSADTIIANIFIMMHRPLYPQGGHKGENLSNADELHNLFVQNPKIKAVLAGHDHLFNYYEKDGVPYITTGGAGAPLHRGYGGDYYHFCKISFYETEHRINLSTTGIFNETVEKYDL
jgi:predicted phosphodiesterase